MTSTVHPQTQLVTAAEAARLVAGRQTRVGPEIWATACRASAAVPNAVIRSGV
jgi:hypothetical protein